VRSEKREDAKARRREEKNKKSAMCYPGLLVLFCIDILRRLVLLARFPARERDKLQHSTAAQRPSDFPSKPGSHRGSMGLIDFWLRPKAALSASRLRVKSVSVPAEALRPCTGISIAIHCFELRGI
jgi:hypothetical protein